MKNTQARFVSGIIFIAAVLAVGIAFRAQTTRATPDDVLQPLASGEVPDSGTFFRLSDYLTSGSLGAPWPFLMTNAPVYSLDGSNFLVDDAVITNDDDLVNALYLLLQPPNDFSVRTMSENSISPNDASDTNSTGSVGGGLYSPLTLTTNDLWLEMIALTNLTGVFIVHPPQAETNHAYDLFMTTNLSADCPGLNATNWTWLLRTAGGQTNIVAFNLANDDGFFLLAKTNDADADGLSDAFEHLVSHSYPTNADTDGDGLPDGWEWYWFGNFNHSATELDADGNTLLYDYENGRDPNQIVFSLTTTNNYVRTNITLMNLSVTLGTPSSIAVLVANTNFDGATWSSYTSSNLTETLGTTDGVYTVWIGLRGRQDISAQTWHELDFTLDRVPPTIGITNPATGSTVSRSLVQVRGWASEPLTSIFYDLTNSDGLVTNQAAYVTGAHLDTNLVAFTTNYFQAYDITLADGTNTFTFRATDLAGNTSSTNFTLVLNSSLATNPPVVTVNWPDTNNPIAGTNFVLSGTVDDPTATVTVSGNGFTNLTAIVERDGRFTIPSVPFLASNNVFTVNVINKAGLGASSVGGGGTRSSVIITVDPIQSSQISRDTMTLTGKVSDTNHDVWVGTIQATVNADGTWEADDVPVNDNAGSQQLNLSAYPAGSDPDATSPTGVQNPIVPLPPIVRSIGYIRKQFSAGNGACGEIPFWTRDTQSWELGSGGHELQQSFSALDGSASGDSPWGTTDYLPALFWNNISTSSDQAKNIYDGGCGAYTRKNLNTESVQTSLELVAGGPATPNQMQLIRLTVSAKTYSEAPDSGSEGDVLVLANLFQSSDLAWTPTATNAYVAETYVAIPAGSTRKLSVGISGANSYSLDVQAEGYSPNLTANGESLKLETPPILAAFCVGQLLTFATEWNTMPPGIQKETNLWSFTGNFFNDGTNSFPGIPFSTGSSNYFINSQLLTNAVTTNWWVSGIQGFPGEIYEATLNKGLTFSNGQTVQMTLKGYFGIFRPQTTISPSMTSVNILPQGGIYFLRFINIVNHQNVDGITFSNTLSSTFPGEIKWLQIVSSETRKLEQDDLTWHTTTFSNAGPYLDTTFPYSAFANGNPVDSPGLSLPDIGYIGAEAGNHFKMYMLFQPTGGMWVPLRVVSWSWEGVATNRAGYWELVSGTNHVDSNLETQNYPFWQDNIINGFWVP